MTLTDTDRRRFVMVTLLTLVALPALWWANTSRTSTSPSVALAGLDVGAADDNAAPVQTGTDVNHDAAREAAQLDAASDPSPVFLDGPSSAAGADIAAVAVPAPPAIEHIVTTATFRKSIPGRDLCIAPGLSNGDRITVVNIDNNRSVVCSVISVPGASDGQVVLTTAAFAEIADLTDAPIAVEIRR